MSIESAIRESDTSWQAKQSIKPHVSRLQEMVLDSFLLHRTSGLTDEQLVEASGLAANTARPRRIEMVMSGRLYDSGERRRTKSGRSAIVWKLRA